MLVPKLNRITNVQPMFVSPYNANAMLCVVLYVVTILSCPFVSDFFNLNISPTIMVVTEYEIIISLLIVPLIIV